VPAALQLAAQAEAYALRSDWPNAETRYRQAIAHMPVDPVRRSWWINLADIEQRLNEEEKRQQALEAAKSPDPNDAMTRRALDLQKSSGFRPDRATAPTRAPAP